MKKAPFITYVGAAAAFATVLGCSNKLIKKYGQPIFPKKNVSLEKIGNTVNKVLDKVGAK